MVNYDKDVYYTKVQYDEKLNKTKEAYIKDKFDEVASNVFKMKIDDLWLDIDHSYMERTINELQAEIRKDNGVTLQQQQNLPDRYELNNLETFTNIEEKFDWHIIRSYNASKEHTIDYLTQKIKDFYKVERTIPYYHNGEIYSMHTPSEYLSMLYNVNLRMASWNQTIKDGEVLGIDTVKLMSHPNACPVCNLHAERLYSINDNGRYPSIDEAYADGVGHPNCKCNFILWWGNMDTVDVRTDNYDLVQKARGIVRDINRLDTDAQLYRYIGNEEEADIALSKMYKLELTLQELLNTYDIESYIF